MRPASPRIFQLKITLRGTRPPIWRRLVVRNTISLGQFHDSLQVAMGWTDSHLHQFMKGNIHYGTPDPEMPEVRDERKAKLKDVLLKPKDRILYEYDFGDGWLHDVVLEQVTGAEPQGKYPWVLAGKKACPPEDCGGVYGYYHFLEAFTNPRDLEHEQMAEWVGEDFDPDAFDVQDKNRIFHGGWHRPSERA